MAFNPKPMLLVGFTLATAALSNQSAKADAIKSGTECYQRGDYSGAVSHFSQAAKVKPPSWKAFYMLANTYMQLKEGDKARKTYEQALVLHPPTDVTRNCQKAIAYINSNPTLETPVAPVVRNYAPAPTQRPSQTESSQPSSGDSAPAVSTELQQRRDRIMKEATDQSNRIRKEAKEKLEEMNSGSNQVWVYPDGTRKTMIDPAVEGQINQEAEKRISDIMDLARRKAADQR